MHSASVRSAALASLALAALGACSGGSHSRRYPAPTADAIEQALAARRAAARAFNHSSTMEFWSGDDRIKTGVYVMGQIDSRIRLQALDPAGGTTVADLACDGAGFAYVDHQNDCQLTGPCTDASIAALLKVRLSPDDFVLLALGQPPSLPGGEVTSVTWDESRGAEVALVRAPDGRSQRLVLDGREGTTWDLVEARGFHKDGKLDWVLTQKDFGELRAPDGTTTLRAGKKLRFEQPASKADLVVVWDERALDPALAADKFTIDVPPGLRRCGDKPS